MSALIAFSKKEWRESLATYRVLIVFGVFAILGLMNVFTAKFTPQLIAHFVSNELATTFPEPTVLDVWLQFFKNVGQIGLVVVVIIFSGVLTQEYHKETLTILLTKGLSRWKVIAAKLIMSSIVFSLGYWLSVAVTYLYAWLYFKEGSVTHLFNAVSLLWVFGLFLVVISLLGGVIFNSNYGVLLFTGGLIIVMFMINLVPAVKEASPLLLGMGNTALIEGASKLSDYYQPLWVTLILSSGMIGLSIPLFNKKSL